MVLKYWKSETTVQDQKYIKMTDLATLTSDFRKIDFTAL